MTFWLAFCFFWIVSGTSMSFWEMLWGLHCDYQHDDDIESLILYTYADLAIVLVVS